MQLQRRRGQDRAFCGRQIDDQSTYLFDHRLRQRLTHDAMPLLVYRMMDLGREEMGGECAAV